MKWRVESPSVRSLVRVGDMDSLALSKRLRSWQEQHPVADIALGFVPVVGQAYGAASAAAALRDPEAGALEKGLSALSFVPGGKLADKIRKIAVGEKTAKGIPALEAALARAKQMVRERAPASADNPVTRGAAGMKQLLAGDPRINDEVFKETGWWVDPDTGRMMTELDDSRSVIDREMVETLHLNAGGKPILAGAEDIMYHPELRKIDPKHLANLNVRLDPMQSTREGQYISAARAAKNKVPGETVEVGTAGYSRNDWPENVNFRDSVMHELQHSYANKEGFSPGTNMAAAGSFQKYLQDPGEILARIGALRRNLTPEGKRKYPMHRHIEEERMRVMDPREKRYATEQDLRRAFALRNLNYDDYAVPAP